MSARFGLCPRRIFQASKRFGLPIGLTAFTDIAEDVQLVQAGREHGRARSGDAASDQCGAGGCGGGRGRADVRLMMRYTLQNETGTCSVDGRAWAVRPDRAFG